MADNAPKPKPDRKQLSEDDLARDFEPTTLSKLKVGDYVAYKTKARTWKNKSGDDIEYASKINQGYVSMVPDPERQQGFRTNGFVWGFKGAHGGAWSQNEKFVEKVWIAKKEVVEARKKAKLEKAHENKSENFNKRKAAEAKQYEQDKKKAQEIEQDPAAMEVIKKARKSRPKTSE